MNQIRPPAVAGMFYPGSSAELESQVEELYEAAQDEARAAAPGEAGSMPGLKGVIAPHAGYVYSGVTAAHAFQRLACDAAQIRRIVLLGPSHRVAIRGAALPQADAFETPLGAVAIDDEGVSQVARLPQVEVNRKAHAQEHSLEVELPFLQRRLHNFRILPLVVGTADPEEVDEILDLVWGGDETRIVISSDLSHYLPYDEARRVDADTAQAILRLAGPLARERACGATPINGLLLAAQRRRLQPQLLDLRNSGDTAGSQDQVVGYGAFAFCES